MTPLAAATRPRDNRSLYDVARGELRPIEECVVCSWQPRSQFIFMSVVVVSSIPTPLAFWAW